jgi:hypothetical protein
MQRLEVSGAVRLIYGSLGVKRLTGSCFGDVVYSVSYKSNFEILFRFILSFNGFSGIERLEAV